MGPSSAAETTAGSVSTEIAVAAAPRPRRHSSDEGDFMVMLAREGNSVTLSLLDRAGNPSMPDFRRHSGLKRELLREFAMKAGTSSAFIPWGAGVSSDVPGVVKNPDPRLIDLAAESLTLVNSDLETVVPAEDEWVLQTRISQNANGAYFANPGLGDGSGDPSGDLDLEIHPRTVSPRHALSGRRLYRVRDLGFRWIEDTALHAGNIPREDLPVFLSIALSRLLRLEVRFGAFRTVDARPKQARPALMFTEVDEYGFLHVRPLSSVDGLKPGFLEEQDITKVAEIDEAERETRVSEIFFPETPDGLFRAHLAAMGKDARTAVFEEDGYFVLPPGFASEFLSRRVSELMGDFDFFRPETLMAYKIRPCVPRVRFAFKSGIDWLAGEARVQLGDESVSYARFLKEYRKQRFVTLSDGSRAFPDAKAMRRLDRLVKFDERDETVSVSFFDLPALERGLDMTATGAAWKKPEAFYRGIAGARGKIGSFPLDGAELRPYQEYGVAWMDYLRGHGLSGCLADEMGLGKTIQTIALLRKVYRDGEKRPSLIVMPRSLLFNWESEFSRFAPDVRVALHYGAGRDTADIADAQVILTSYAVTRLDIGELAEREFCYVILDEAQTVKNFGTKTAKAALALRSSHRLALTGTPVENSLGDLYSIFSFLNPGMLGKPKEFEERWVGPIQETRDDDALRDLRARIYPFLLRRLKREVVPDLPEKTEQVAWIELDEAHLAAYKRRAAELKTEIYDSIERNGLAQSRFLVLKALTELRRIASVPEAEGLPVEKSAKREYLLDMAKEIAESGHKCLVFSNYLATVDLVSSDFAENGIGNLVMTGATSDRQSLVRRFQTDPEAKAFVMTLKTGGLGLNLTAADYVFIFDPWWNRAAESQAIDRTHRIGQKNPVFCHRIIAKDTIEERILELQERKAELAGAVIGSDADAFKALDADDIRRLME